MDQAKDDLVQIKRYIAKRSGTDAVAMEFVGRLRAQCLRLAELPGQIGQLRPDLAPHLRSYAYGNYVILYRYRESVLEVISIIEGHRDIDALFDSD